MTWDCEGKTLEDRTSKRGFIWTDWDFTRAIKQGKITGVTNADKQVQPGSLDVCTTNEMFAIPEEFATKIRNNPERDLYSIIKELGSSAKKIDISKPTDLRLGKSYLLPTDITISIPELDLNDPLSYMTIQNSPKSSVGRTFLDSRALFENGQHADSISNHPSNAPRNGLTRPWILVTPQFIEVIITEGIALSQLRFSSGFDAQLNECEMIEALQKYGIVSVEENGTLEPINFPEHKDNILALHARLTSRDKEQSISQIPIDPRKGYLIETDEILQVPPHLCIQMLDYDNAAIQWRTHKAGFIDAGFKGSIVSESESFEKGRQFINSKSILGGFVIYRHGVECEHPYGDKNTYLGQTGATYGKYFAKNIDPRTIIALATRKTTDIFEPVDLSRKRTAEIEDYFEIINSEYR